MEPDNRRMRNPSQRALRDAKSQKAKERMVSAYDRWMIDPLQAAFFGHSDYYNYGYSTDQTVTQQQACENLVEQLLALIPDKSGAILDVACGLGASTKHLPEYYSAAPVTGINISDRQLERAKTTLPPATF